MAKLLPYVVLILGVGLLVQMRMGWLYGLPLSRRSILWLKLAGTAMPFLLGMAAGTWIYRPSFFPVQHPSVGEFIPGVDPGDSQSHGTNVALEYWRHAPGGRVPSIEAPWGETVVPRSLSILGFVLYNPYTVRKQSSDRFFEWQFENAAQALHGRRISYAQYRYGNRPEYPQHNRLNVVTLWALAFELLFAVYLRELTLSRRLSGKRFAQAFAAGAVALLGGGLMLGDVLFSRALPDSMVFSSLLQALFMRVAALPLPTWALAAIGAVPCVAMYLLLDWQSRRSEIVNSPAVTTSL
jgi:hypothetical protein